MKWIFCVVALLVCSTAHAQCPGGNCGGITFRSPVTFGNGFGWRAPAVRYAAPPPVWTTVRVYDPAPVFLPAPTVTYLPPVEFVETLPPIVERVEYIEPARVVQRVERRSTSARVNARPQLVFSNQTKWSWPGDLREHMRREHGLSAATLAELSDSQVMALHDWEHDER